MDTKILTIVLISLVTMVFLVGAKLSPIKHEVNLTLNQNIYEKYNSIALKQKINTNDYINEKVESFLNEDYNNELLNNAKEKVSYIDTDEIKIKEILSKCLNYVPVENQTTEDYRNKMNELIESLDEDKLIKFIKC